ncbi:hypothetical protein RIF29_35573 [Crotalaria pallida]|uniref:Uncharacterized protein n=1 Tax=Crotalaria pallida TaxID=3830 RepID=A0AAN9HTV4_CROPI
MRLLVNPKTSRLLDFEFFTVKNCWSTMISILIGKYMVFRFYNCSSSNVMFDGLVLLHGETLGIVPIRFAQALPSQSASLSIYVLSQDCCLGCSVVELEGPLVSKEYKYKAMAQATTKVDMIGGQLMGKIGFKGARPMQKIVSAMDRD